MVGEVFQRSEKEVKRESIIGSLHRRCIRPGAPRRQHNDTLQKESQSTAGFLSLLSSKQVLCNYSSRPRAQPLSLLDSRFTSSSHVDCGNSPSNEPSLGGGPKTSQSWPLPKPGHIKIEAHAIVGEGDMATPSNSSDTYSDADDPFDSHLISPQASDYENGIRSVTTNSTGSKQRGPLRVMLKPANMGSG